MGTEKIDVKAALRAAENAAQQIKAAADGLRQERSDLTKQLAALSAQNALMLRQPLARSEVKEAVLLAIDRWGDEFRQNWLGVLQDFAAPKGLRPPMHGPVNMDTGKFEVSSGPMTLQDLDAITAGEHSTVLTPALPVHHRGFGAMLDPYRNLFSGVLDASYTLDNPQNQQRALKGAFFFFGDLIKAKVQKHFDSDVYPDMTLDGSGSEKEARAALMRNAERITALRAEIASIEAEVQQLKRIDSLQREIASYETELPPDRRSGATKPLQDELQRLGGAESSPTERRLCAQRLALRLNELHTEVETVAASAVLPVDLRRSFIASNERRMVELQAGIEAIDGQLAQMKASIPN